MAVVASLDLVEMLRRMYRIRRFDEAAIVLHNAGEMPGPMHTSIGQEAEVVGACMALTDQDYMTGNHRSHGHPIGKGASVRELMAELLGRSTGVCRGKGGSMHLADFKIGSLGESGIVGAGLPIAVGAALSAQLRGTDQVALAFFGDGASNAGPFHESLNLAAIWKLPAVFLCENNGYAVTASARDMVSVSDIATRAMSYDIPGVVVDGQDALVVHEAVSVAVARARAGDGPSLLDVKTYRYRNHAEFGGLESRLKKYRSDEEVAEWVARDPITILGEQLIHSGVIDQDGIARIDEQVTQEIADAVSFAQASEFPDLRSAYEGLYAAPFAPLEPVMAAS
jgi:acetoin:2,6-dichlorophenolindophenol oxidoreductase subunit alpha